MWCLTFIIWVPLLFSSSLNALGRFSLWLPLLVHLGLLHLYTWLMEVSYWVCTMTTLFFWSRRCLLYQLHSSLPSSIVSKEKVLCVLLLLYEIYDDEWGHTHLGILPFFFFNKNCITLQKTLTMVAHRIRVFPSCCCPHSKTALVNFCCCFPNREDALGSEETKIFQAWCIFPTIKQKSCSQLYDIKMKCLPFLDFANHARHICNIY